MNAAFKHIGLLQCDGQGLRKNSSVSLVADADFFNSHCKRTAPIMTLCNSFQLMSAKPSRLNFKILG